MDANHKSKILKRTPAFLGHSARPKERDLQASNALLSLNLSLYFANLITRWQEKWSWYLERSPLIGVRHWKDLHEDVKNDIAESVMKIRSQNSSNRQQLRTNHSMGSKPFSQCSYEKNNTARKLSLTESDEMGDDEPRSFTSEAAKEDYLF
uniref:Uncharacterized protein n=1 Tax=Leersia perrieri TaxID=77586 RepID=A0A0D9XJF4_9ORYZ